MLRCIVLCPSPTPELVRLLWEHAALESCLRRLVQLLDMAVIDAPGEVGEELRSALYHAQRLVGLAWENCEDLWTPPDIEDK